DCSAVVDAGLDDAGTDPVWRARLLALRAKVLVTTGAPEECERAARQALAEGERLGDPIAQGQALGALYLISDSTGGQAYLDRALAVVGPQPETAELRITALSNNAFNLSALGHHEPAERLIQEALILAEQIGSWRVPQVRVTAGSLFIL